MDIFNRPPAIAEDCLVYTIYPPVHSIDRPATTSLATVIQEHVDTLLPGHLWHRDRFELKVITDPDAQDAWILEGHMRVGDSVDDEWCVVWLLREISAKWDVVISVCDSDGEFLLIEAAEELPNWVTPTNAENRVWIYASHLHLIPPSYVSAPSSKRRRRRYPTTRPEGEDEGDNEASNDDFLNVADAVKLVRDEPVETRASQAVEAVVWKRISGYPGAVKQHVHTTLAWVPHDIARALSIDPSLVQKPIETFYTRDALQLRAAHKMSRFPPEPSVLCPIKMTRTAYAQLMGQKFHPPKIFGRWGEREGTKEWRYRDVGMKISCGFEMLYQESKNRNEGVSSAGSIETSLTARKDALRRNPEYMKYIQSLVAVGYFQGELESSENWNRRENKAAEMFVEVRREDDASRQTFATQVVNAIARANDEALKPKTEGEDSDDWLNVDARDFDEMLERTMGSAKKNSTKLNPMDIDGTDESEDRAATEQANRLQDLAKKVESFVEGKGDIEGARFDDERSDSDDVMSDFSDEEFPDSDDESDGNHEAEHRAARQAAMDALVPALAANEYGKMPASYYSTSQTVASSAEEDAPQADVSTKQIDSTPLPKMRPPILQRDKYEGVDSDDESEEDETGGFGDYGVDKEDEEDEEDRPQVVGDIDIDMDEEEEEFLDFARKSLGISEEQWGDIIQDRRSRGAFVPKSVKVEGKSRENNTPATESQSQSQLRNPVSGPRPNVNPNLDSFEAVMQAMDAELVRQKGASGTTRSTASTAKARVPQEASANNKDKGKAKAIVRFADAEGNSEDEDVDIEAAMEAELKAALAARELGDDESDEEGAESMDYNLIKNFLESFKSQGGLSGPVGNLAGRLQEGWTFPRDES